MDEVGQKFEIGLFNERNNCTLWQSTMKNLLARSLLKWVGMKLRAVWIIRWALHRRSIMMFLRSSFSRNLFGIEMKTDRRVRLNCLNWLMNQLKNLDATIVVLLETEKLMKQGLGDSDVRALVIDARDFVLTYTVMVKNGSLEVTIWVLVILKGLKNKTKEFLFEGRHWRMDVDGLMMTVKSVVEPYWVQGEDCWVKA